MPPPPLSNTPPLPDPGWHQAMGHFGELLQGRLGRDGPVALITLPCPVLTARVLHRPGALALHQPDGRVLSLPRARAFLRALGLPVSGRFALRLTMLPGGGAGASTAALVALARAAGADPAQIASACHAVEGASDPLMVPRPARLLWASRAGRVLAHLPPLPRIEVIGGHWGAPQRTDPSDLRFPDISDLVAAWPAACTDLPQLADLVSQSAQRTLALRGPARDPTHSLARQTGALGFAIAHTGSARSLIFAPGTAPPDTAGALRKAGFTRIIRFRIGGDHA